MNQMRGRIVILFALLVIWWLGIVIRAVTLQILPNDRLAALQERKYKKMVHLAPRRGMILDRNGRELAVTIPAHSAFADPTRVTEPRRWARMLAPLLGLPRSVLYARLTQKNRRFVWLKRQLTPEVKQKIEALKAPGIAFIEEPQRVYLHSTLLSQVMGFVGTDGHGLEGLELQFDQVLAGEGRRIDLRRDARGRPLVVSGQMFMDSPEGDHLHLTIDSELQFMVEKELEKTVESQEAASAVAVVMDVETSEVVALANHPTFDPNRVGREEPWYRRNRAITDAFEPGSTVKPFVAAAALHFGVAQPNSRYDCEGGRLEVGGRIIRESESDAKHRFGDLTVTEILTHSSNVGTAKLAFDVGNERLLQVLERFGFGRRTGLEFPGEAAGILQPLPWRPHLLANISFGQGMTATPIQIAAAYAAIANRGVWRRPALVRGFVHSESGAFTAVPRDNGRVVISAKDAETLALMLTSVTLPGGTGGAARVPGYPVAGKTGTAQKVAPTGGYSRTDYIASFVGFFPAHAPRYVVYVAVDSPRRSIYGGQVAAPLFGRIATSVARRSGLEPILISERDVLPVARRKRPSPTEKASAKGSAQPGHMPNVLGLSLREALRLVGPLGPSRLQIRGEGRVTRTVPIAGDLVAGRPVKILLE